MYRGSTKKFFYGFFSSFLGLATSEPYILKILIDPQCHFVYLFTYSSTVCEAYTAEQADIPKYNYDAEKATEFIKSKSKENSSKQQLKTLICLFCDKKFENEDLIKDHTNIEHKSGRLRFKRI